MTISAAPDDAAWGETAIAQSWDQVVSDYKTFHDIRAQGGTVDDLPAHLQERPDAKPETERVPAVHGRGGSASGEGAGEEQAADRTQTDAEASTASAIKTPPPPLPQAVLGSMNGNDHLKKLLMSWYYAGYYTGLYEGQQQAQAQAQARTQGPSDNEAQP